MKDRIYARIKDTSGKYRMENIRGKMRYIYMKTASNNKRHYIKYNNKYFLKSTFKKQYGGEGITYDDAKYLLCVSDDGSFNNVRLYGFENININININIDFFQQSAYSVPYSVNIYNENTFILNNGSKIIAFVSKPPETPENPDKEEQYLITNIDNLKNNIKDNFIKPIFQKIFEKISIDDNNIQNRNDIGNTTIQNQYTIFYCNNKDLKIQVYNMYLQNVSDGLYYDNDCVVIIINNHIFIKCEDLLKIFKEKNHLYKTAINIDNTKIGKYIVDNILLPYFDIMCGKFDVINNQDKIKAAEAQRKQEEEKRKQEEAAKQKEEAQRKQEEERKAAAEKAAAEKAAAEKAAAEKAAAEKAAEAQRKQEEEKADDNFNSEIKKLIHRKKELVSLKAIYVENPINTKKFINKYEGEKARVILAAKAAKKAAAKVLKNKKKHSFYIKLLSSINAYEKLEYSITVKEAAKAAKAEKAEKAAKEAAEKAAEAEKAATEAAISDDIKKSLGELYTEWKRLIVILEERK